MGVTLFFPIFPPIIILEFGICFFVFCNRKAIESTPSLLKPILFINALSFGKRNNLGLSFPACGKGVTVPISTKPKPRHSNSFKYLAFLSKPAPRPTRFGNSKSQILNPRFPFGVKDFAISFLKPMLQRNFNPFIEK